MSLFGGGHKSAAQTPTRAMGIDLQGAQYGSPIPVVFGRNKLAGNVIDYMDFKAIAHTQKQQGGKGGGGGGQSSTSYTYQCSYLLGLAEGVGNIVNVYDGSSTTSLTAVGGLAFTGAQGQAAWAHLSGDHALGYSGTVLAAFQNKDLGSSASLPNYNFEIDGRSQFGGGIVDANPADITTAICTDSQIGVQFNALGDLTAFKNYCTAAGLFFSPVYSTQTPAQQTLDDLFKYANSAPFFSEGVLKVVPYGDTTITGNGVTYTPNLTAVADLGRDDFVTNGPGDPVTVKRIAPADAMNIQRVEFKDRANTYHTGTVVASIDQDVVGTGARADQSDSVDMVTQASVAKLVAQNLLQRTYYIRNTYEFQLPWRYCYLEPMDIVTLTDANTGLYLTPVRITEVSEDEHGLLSIVAEEFPEGVSHASIYATQPNAGTTVNPNADPGPVNSPYLFRGPGFLVSNNQPEIWIALSGTDPLWAGCDVYLSQDGTSYTYLTTHSHRAAYGSLTNGLPLRSDPDTISTPNAVLNGPVELLGGTRADADQFITLAMVDNEIIAYQTASLQAGPSYTLGYIRRGGYGSAIVAHSAGAPFVRLDENILRIPVDPSQIGQTVYLKFVSFNVFGKGGRTLASETAYQYVIGTNVELPDVPVTPASPACTAVADGVALTWFNPNPAAVGCTAIEYATASTGPWTVLAFVGPTTTAHVHHFTSGATYYYRLRSRGPVVSAGWSAYTAVLTNKGKTVDDGSDVTGNVTGTPVKNPNFNRDLAGWTFDTSGTGEWFQEALTNSPDASVGTYMVHKGVTGQVTTCAHNTYGGIPVKPGQGVVATVALRSLSANAGAKAYVRIGWLNASGAVLTNSTLGVTICTPDSGTNYFTQGTSRVYGFAPTGAVRAIVEIEFDSHTSGFFSATNASIGYTASNQDEVPDGATYIRNIQHSANSSALSINNAMFQLPLDASGNIPGWVNDTAALFYLNSTSPSPSYGTQYAVVKGPGRALSSQSYAVQPGDTISIGGLMAALNGVTGYIQAFIYNAAGTAILGINASTTSSSWTQVSGTGVVPTGGVYMRIGLYAGTSAVFTVYNFVWCSINDVRVAGSGATLGNQLNAPNSLTLNYGGVRSATALTAASTGAVSINAHTIYMGGTSVHYNAVTNAVTGLAVNGTYQIYCHDSGGTGGTKTWFAAGSIAAALQQGDDVVIAGQVTIPSSGTSGGGGTGSCPSVEAWVIRRAADGAREYVRAGDVGEGDYLLLSNSQWGEVTYSRAKFQPGVRVLAENGKALTCSRSAPLEIEPGHCVLASDCEGLAVRMLGTGSNVIAAVHDVGDIWVQHITCENDCFWTGDEPDGLFSHHNFKPA